jgi:hypothetical protein
VVVVGLDIHQKLLWGQRSVAVVPKQCCTSFVMYKGWLRGSNKCATRQMKGLYNVCWCDNDTLFLGVIPLGGVVEECRHLRDTLFGERSPLGCMVACMMINNVLIVTV